MESMRKTVQAGQALLIVLLVTAVALTVGLAAVSRSVTEVEISREEEEAVRAFSAAEAGIEEVLKSLPDFTEYSGEFGEGNERVRVTAEATTEGESGFETGPVAEGDVVEVNLEGASGASRVEVCWDGEAVVEIVVVREEGGEYKIERGLYGGSFGGVAPGDCGSSFSEIDTQAVVSLPSTPIAMRIRPFGAESYVAVRPQEGSLPPQQYVVESTGRVVGSGVTRKIRVTRAIRPALPVVFDYALFSGTVIQ